MFKIFKPSRLGRFFRLRRFLARYITVVVYFFIAYGKYPKVDSFIRNKVWP